MLTPLKRLSITNTSIEPDVYLPAEFTKLNIFLLAVDTL